MSVKDWSVEELDDVRPQDLFNSDSDEETVTRKAKNKTKDFEAEAKELFQPNKHKNEDKFNKKSNEEEDNESESKLKKKLKVKKAEKLPKVTLNYDTLARPNGLPALKKRFQNFKFKGTGHEMEDLTNVLRNLQQWMHYQLFPSFDFETCMSQLEILGEKRKVQTLMKKYRMGMDEWGEEEQVTNKDDSPKHPGPDNWLDYMIANIPSDDSDFSISEENLRKYRDVEMEVFMTDEQRARIAKNRKLAEERRAQRMKERQEMAAFKISEFNNPGTSNG